MKILRHLFIVLLLLGLAASNLEIPQLERPVNFLGLRQYWAMFAPNPVHVPAFLEATAIYGHTEEVLHIADEPPMTGFFMEIGYNRILKFHKKVVLKPERFAPAYARALCNQTGANAIDFTAIRYFIPGPKKRLQGEGALRILQPMGRYPC